VRVILLQGGNVTSGLASIVREQTDLVVLAAHGRSGQLSLPCGSVTADLIARASVPILVVRSRAARARGRIAPDLETPAVRLPRYTSS
jgi:nucleotide-binding universal stress UspA family protein